MSVSRRATLYPMRRTLGPLLCELHAHTRWSDGELTVRELVDLHGRGGFDVPRSSLRTRALMNQSSSGDD